MNRKEILEDIQVYLSIHHKDLQTSVLGDQLILTQEFEGNKCAIKIRAQSFGNVMLFSPKGMFIKVESLERQFQDLLIDELKNNYNSDFTLAIGSSSLEVNSVIQDYRIEKEIDLIAFKKHLKLFIIEAQDRIFSKLNDANLIAEYISQFDYASNLKVLVGGKFPVNSFKKMFLLYKGGQIDRYEEYKEGLMKQIESFPLRKPKRKEEAKWFSINFDQLVKALESLENTKPTV